MPRSDTDELWEAVLHSRRQRQDDRDKWEFLARFLLWSLWCGKQATVVRYICGVPRATLRRGFNSRKRHRGEGEDTEEKEKTRRDLRVIANRMPQGKKELVDLCKAWNVGTPDPPGEMRAESLKTILYDLDQAMQGFCEVMEASRKAAAGRRQAEAERARSRSRRRAKDKGARSRSIGRATTAPQRAARSSRPATRTPKPAGAPSRRPTKEELDWIRARGDISPSSESES